MAEADRDGAARGGVAISPWLSVVALLALVSLVYWPTLGNGYVSDDLIYVQGIRELASLGGLRDIWCKLGTIPQYYPLVHASFWFEYRLWGLDPRGFHAMNLATHFLVTLLVWRTLSRLRVPGSWLAAAIFAVHPVQVESVAWASERKNLLSAAFALASMLAYLRFAPFEAPPANGDTRRTAIGYYLLALALYLASLASKTVTVTTPAVLLVIRWWKTGRLAWRDVRPLLPFLALGLPLACLTVWMERAHVGATGAAWNLGPIERILIAGRAVCFYLGKLAWPHPLGFVYPRWRVDSHAPWQWIFPTGVAAGLALLWTVRERVGRGPLAAGLMFVGMLFPALGFFDVYPFLYSFVADHYQYHASVAPIALTAATMAVASRRAGSGAPALQLAGAAAIIAVLGLLAHRQTLAYRDDETLIRATAASRPDSWSARYRLGVVFQNEHRYEEAIGEFREALRLFPEYARLHAAIGVDLVSLGRLDEAAAEFGRALAGDLDEMDRSATHAQLAALLSQQGRFAEAADHFGAAAALAKEPSEMDYNRGIALGKLGDLPGAIAALRDSVANDANVAASQYALGMLLFQGGDAAAATKPLRQAVRLAPANALYRERLGAVLLKGDDAAQAEEELRRAITLDPHSASAHNLLGLALGLQADLPAAIEQFREALRIDPTHAEAAANLQRALASHADR